MVNQSCAALCHPEVRRGIWPDFSADLDMTVSQVREHVHFLSQLRELPMFRTILCLLMCCTFTMGVSQAEDSMWVYVAGDGIHQYSFDLDTGALEHLSSNQDAKPSFLAFHPSEQFIYGCGKNLCAFSIDPKTGELTLLNTVPYDKHGLCHLSVDKTGANVLSAGYGAGTVVVQRIAEDGRLGEQADLEQHEGSSVLKNRQEGPHAHSVNLDAENNFAFAADLGLDKILIYRFDAAKGKLEPSDQPWVATKPGAGPRHFSFHPNGRFAYVINELDSTVGAYRYDKTKGRLEEIETQKTLPADFERDNSTAEVVVHPSGRFLYGSNRGHNSIAVFGIDDVTGELTFVEHMPTGGKWPRNFCVDPTGKFLLAANQQSNNIHVFRIDGESGKLTPTPHAVDVSGPNCVRFLRPKT